MNRDGAKKRRKMTARVWWSPVHQMSIGKTGVLQPSHRTCRQIPEKWIASGALGRIRDGATRGFSSDVEWQERWRPMTEGRASGSSWVTPGLGAASRVQRMPERVYGFASHSP